MGRSEDANSRAVHSSTPLVRRGAADQAGSDRVAALASRRGVGSHRRAPSARPLRRGPGRRGGCGTDGGLERAAGRFRAADVLLCLALLTAGGLWSATFGLAGPAFLLGILLLGSGGLLHAKDPLEIVTLFVGRLAFAVGAISGVYLGMSASSATPFPGRQVAIDIAVVTGLVFVMALIVARSRGWRMGPESPGSIGWSLSSGGSGSSSSGSWSSGGSSSWSSSSSSFSGGGGSSGGGGASGSG